MEGLVIKSTGSRYWVELIDGQVVEARIKGKFRLQGIRTTNPLAVGDRVDVEGEQIVRIHERKNYIIRIRLNTARINEHNLTISDINFTRYTITSNTRLIKNNSDALFRNAIKKRALTSIGATH